MGNEFMDKETAQTFSDKTTLAKYIIDFYKNDYKFFGIYDGPKFAAGADPNTMIAPMLADKSKYKLMDGIKDSFTKKRACCLGQGSKNIPISLPSYEGKDDKNKPKMPITVLNVPIYTDAEITNIKATCKIDDKDYSFQKLDSKQNPISGDSCNNFYGAASDVLNDQRRASYAPADKKSTVDKMFYGPYQSNSDKTTQNPFLSLNAFKDFNCLNSPYMRKDYKPNVSGGAVDEVIGAHTFDSNCYQPLGKQQAFAQSNMRNEQICINSIEIQGSVVAANNSGVNMSQKCSNTSTSDSQVTAKADDGKVVKTGPVDQTIVGAGAGTDSKPSATYEECVAAVENTGFIPTVTWGSTAANKQDATCDRKLCDYWPKKYPNGVPDKYKSSIAGCPTTATPPAANTPAANTPAANTPAANTPAANTPAANTPAANTPAANTPAANTPAANTPAAPPAANTPASPPASPPVSPPVSPPPAAASVSFMDGQMIAGVPNKYLVYGGGVLILLLIIMMFAGGGGGGGRRRRYED